MLRPPLTPTEYAVYCRLLGVKPWLAHASIEDKMRAVELFLYRPSLDWHRPPRGRAEGGPPAPPEWAGVPEAEIEAWRARDLGERWATPPGIARCLTWLEHQFSGGRR
jgi:hypothetical protein